MITWHGGKTCRDKIFENHSNTLEDIFSKHMSVSGKGADDMQAHSRGKIGIHSEHAALDIHRNGKVNGYI